MTDLNEFDLYQRYLTLQSLLQNYCQLMNPNSKQIKLLDLGGGGTEFTRQVAPEQFEIFQADIRVDNPIVTLLTPGAKLPFADQSFDVVITMDVVEHVPQKERQLFLKESKRVARDLVIHACPTYHPLRILAEARVYTHHKKYLSDHNFFREHEENGLPLSWMIKRIMRQKRWSCATVQNTPLMLWEIFSKLDFEMYANKEDIQMTLPLHHFENTLFHNSYKGKLHYRTFFISSSNRTLVQQLVNEEMKKQRLSGTLAASKEQIYIQLMSCVCRHFRAQLQSEQKIQQASDSR